MVASRLMTLLLLLQARQRMTTGELAERLEVSRRTVLRDVDALSSAGVPVYAERGRHGGIVLLAGARLNASHLDPPELEALSIPGLDRAQLERLGLAVAAQSAADKLAARRGQLPGSRAATAPLTDLIVAENNAWMTSSGATVDVGELASALRTRRRLRIRYRPSGAERDTGFVVDPYGLAAKSSRWYLVADRDQCPQLFSLDRLAAYESLEAPAVRRSGATLESVWAELKERTETSHDLAVEARLRRSRIDLARRVLGTRLQQTRSVDDDWCEVTIRYADLESVRQLLQFGDHIEVLAPEPARQRVHELARDLAQRHARPTGRPPAPGDGPPAPPPDS